MGEDLTDDAVRVPVPVVTRVADTGSPQPPAPPPPPSPPSWVAGAFPPAWGAGSSPLPRWTRERVVDPVPGGVVVARLAGCAVTGALILLLSSISVIVLLGTYAPELVARHAPGVDGGRLWIAIAVVVCVLAAVWRGRRSFQAAAHAAGAPGVDAFLAAPAPPDPAANPEASDATVATPEPAAAVTPPARIAPMRRSTLAAVALAIGGAGLVLAGQLAMVAAPGAARSGAAVVIAGALTVVGAAGLLPGIFRGADRRLAEADRRARGGLVRIRPARHGVAIAAIAVLVAGIGGFAFGASGPGIHPAGCEVKPGWTCAVVRVPANRLAADPGSEIVEMAYAIHPATAPTPGSARRVLVVAVGGPGVPGIPDADFLYGLLGSRVREQFDVVLYDPRGTGLTDPRDCPAAAGRYYDTDTTLTTAHVRDFVDRCLEESGVGDIDLRQFGTDEVVEDIDALRAVIGTERISLYGVSYGTVVAQAYAAAHPDRLDALVLDAPIDRALPPATAWTDAAMGFKLALAETFRACGEDSACHEALPAPTRTWERLLGEVTNGRHIDGDVIDEAGGSFAISLDERAVWNLATAAMYDTTARTTFLRALAAYDGGDPDGLARLWWAWAGDTTSSSFAYYATWCADARLSPTARTDDFDAYVRVAWDAGVREDGYQSIAHATAPCLYWPAQPDRFAPPPEATTVPTLILGATTDPVTPIEDARAILERHEEARLVETRGGAHGSIGDDCPTERMTTFLVDGRLPVGRTSVCLAPVADPFVPLAPSPVSTARDAAEGLYRELFAHPQLLDWPGDEELVIGCGQAGTATFQPADDAWRADVTLDGCAWASGVAMSGSGTLDLDDWTATLDLEARRGTIHLETDGRRWHLDGTWDGKPVFIDE